MKRKVLFTLSLVTWILVCCTIFSFKIEKLMTARVVTVERPSFGAAVLPLEAALRDETGWHLYYTYEGAGWESGTRVAELGSGSYTVYDDPEAVDEITGLKIRPHVEAAAPWKGTLIEYFSHPLKAGEPAEILNKREHSDDTWLVISAVPFPEVLSLPSGLALAARNDTSLLLTVPDEPQPFLESEARARLANTKELAEQITPLARGDLRIYSLEDAKTFLNAIPRLAMILVLTLTPIFLLPPMFLTRSGRRRLVIIAINSLLIVSAAAALWCLVDGLFLPTSLLPVHTVFDFRHYSRALGQVFQSLNSLADNSIADAVLSAYTSSREASHVILLTGVSIPLAISALEAFINCMLVKRKSRIDRNNISLL